MVTFPHMVLGVALRADTWRRVAYGLLALPIGLLGLLSPAPAHWLGRRLGLPGYDEAPEPRSGGRVLGFGLLAVPLNLAAFALTAYTLFGLVLNLAYPIRVEGFPGVLAHPLSPFEGIRRSVGRADARRRVGGARHRRLSGVRRDRPMDGPWTDPVVW